MNTDEQIVSLYRGRPLADILHDYLWVRGDWAEGGGRPFVRSVLECAEVQAARAGAWDEGWAVGDEHENPTTNPYKQEVDENA